MESAELREIMRLEQKFDNHIMEDRKYMDDMRVELAKLWEAVRSRVTWVWLWTITVFFLSTTSGIFYLLFDELKSMRIEQTRYYERQDERSSKIQADVSKIQGKFEPYNIEFKN